jgi:hypothetical protein
MATKKRRNAELSTAHKSLADQFKSSAERERLYAEQKRAVVRMPGIPKDNKQRYSDEADFHAAHAQRFVQAAARVPFLSVEQVEPLARKLARATPKQVDQLAVAVLDLYAKRAAYEEGVNAFLKQKAAALPVERASARGEQGALFAAKKYRVQTLTPGEQGSLFAPSPVSVPASAIQDRVKLDAKRAESFERNKRFRETVLAELGATVRATGQAIALEGPRGNVLAVVRLTAENGRGRRKPASCYCVRKNAPRAPLESARIELTRAESERWHAGHKRTVSEVLAAARAAVTETGRAVTVRDVDGVAVAVAKIRPRR